MLINNVLIGYLGDIKHAVLQTSNKSGSDPEWNETFQISLSSFQQKAFEHWPILTLEAWDYNQLVPNVFLGSVELSPAIYLSKKTDTFALKPSKKASHNGHVRGTMKLTFAPGSGLSSLTRHVSIRGIKSLFKVQIIRGSIERHPKIISKHFNPFVTLKLNGVIIGSTISSSSLHPRWDNQSFILDLFSVPLHLSLHLNMELNSKNMQSGKTDFLGEYRIGLMELLQPEVHEVEACFYSILSGPEDPISCTLTYMIKRVFEIESMSVEPVRYDANRIMSSGRQLATDCLTIEAISDIDSVRRKRRLSMFIENPFQRLSHIPEDIYKRITSASLSGDELQLKVGSADVIVMPSAVAPDVGRINLACRFPAGKLSREKKEFLYRMNGTLLERLNVVRERGLRWKAFVDLPEGIKHLSLPIVSSIEEVIPRYLKKIRDVTGCSCEAYLLDTVNGATVFSKVSVEPSKNLTEEILGQLSALCKQGILFQFYNDAAHIHCFSWSCLSQINLRGLQSAASELDATLGANFVNLLLTSVRQQLNDGCFVVPLIAHEEVFLGLLMLRQTNSVPAVLYDPGIEFDPLDRAMSLFSAPEEGLISALCDTAPLIASFLFSKRTDGAVHHIRGFSLDADHTYADVVKFAFKEISIAVPAIREVSLWRSFSRPRSVIGNMLASYLDQCIVVGCFEAANMAKMATVSAGDIASLYQKSKWTMKFPFTITLPEQLVKQAVFRSVLEDMRANVALMSSDTLGINMCEIKRYIS